MGLPDNRKANRSQEKIPVELKGGDGVTRDLSISGVYFETGLSFTAGQSIEFTIVFGEHTLNPKRMTCHGEIVRVEANGPKLGVATKLHSPPREQALPHDDQKLCHDSNIKKERLKHP